MAAGEKGERGEKRGEGGGESEGKSVSLTGGGNCGKGRRDVKGEK
jgi:hypothetical protein